MASFLIRRVILALLVAVTVSILTFALLRLSGDPAVAMAGSNARVEDIEAIRSAFGLDRPIAEQYFSWLVAAVQGDLGESYYFREPVARLIVSRLPVTLVIGFWAIVLAIALAIPLGVLAATRPNTFLDRLISAFAVGGYAIPNFWLSLLLIYLFSVKLRVLPASGVGTWQHLVMPVLVLASSALPPILRLTRAGMIEVLEADFIRTARAKGIKARRILFRHALKNALPPVISLGAIQFGYMLAGAVVIETVFAVQGIGYLSYQSIVRGDIPTMQSCILLFSLFFVFSTLLADLINAWLDPRVRLH